MSEEQQHSPTSAPERGPSGHHHGHSRLPAFTFLEELKRRNVGRVAILYIILGYVVLEVFGVFVHLLDLPPWVGRSAVIGNVMYPGHADLVVELLRRHPAVWGKLAP